MEEIYYHGIDIGSAYIKFITLSLDKEHKKTKIIAKNSYPSLGVSNGYISNLELFNKSFSSALNKFQKETKQKISEAVFSIDSYGTNSKKIKINHQVLNQAEISDVDITEIERKINLLAKKNIQGKIIYSSLVKYKINNYEYYSNIEGLAAKKIEAEYIFVYLPENHILNLEKIAAKNDISILNFSNGNIEAAKNNLEKEDLNLGVLNIEIGADKTIFSIWENGNLNYLESLNYGSNDISKKISFDKKISFNEAEKLKRNNDQSIQKIIEEESQNLAKKIKDEILEQEKILPAGAVIYGGGAKNDILKVNFREILSMPIKKYSKNISDSNTDYQNIYSSLISFIKNEEKEKIFDFSKILRFFKK